MYLKRVALFSIFSLIGVMAFAQADSLQTDTSYYERFRRKLIITPFLVKNASAFTLTTPEVKDRVRYYTNAPVGLGLRVGFDWLSLSASYGIGLIDPDFNKSKGKTKTLNLNTTFAARKFIADVYFQSHKGMYMRAGAVPPYTQELFYVRPDVTTRLLGASGLWIFNSKKFTARPPFKYDAWQKRSAGSLLAGVEFLSGSAKGDSALIPSAYQNIYPHAQVNKVNYFLFGPSAGYGYTFVADKYFFVTAIGSLNADVGYVKEYNTATAMETVDERWRFDPNVSFRGGVGYNTPRWELAFSYFTKRLFLTGKTNDNRYLTHNNDYRLSYTRRINAGKTIPKVVDWAGDIIEDLGFGFLIGR